jgi:6-phosphogluconolactonase (cycloisomerase 2 family)
MLSSQKSLRCPALFYLAVLALAGCVSSGENRNIPPAPTSTAGPGAAFLYVTEARDPAIGTNGGRVSLYRLAADGGLSSSPIASISAINPRRLLKHPSLPVLYVAEIDHITAFNIAGGTLQSLCPPGTPTLQPPCATNQILGSDPVDMAIANGFLYVVERGNGQDVAALTRVAAYELDENGGLPAYASSQANNQDSITFQSLALTPSFVYVSDSNLSLIARFTLQPDGNLPDPAPTPSPAGETPAPATPTPLPPTPLPSPTPTGYRAFFPQRILKQVYPQASPGPGPTTILYIAETTLNKILGFPIDAGGGLPNDASSGTNTRGVYDSLLIDPAATHLYASAFRNGQIDYFQLDPNGNLVPNSILATLPDPASFPTGLAWLEIVSPSQTLRTLYVAAAGHGRIDAYSVAPDGTIQQTPTTSTTPIDGSFPDDVVVYVP